LAVAGLTAGGCSKDPVAPPTAPGPENTIGIQEDVVVAASGALAPSATNAGQHTFDLGGVTIVSSGEVNDFQVLYTTSTACDADLEFFNVRTQEWDPVAIDPGGTCFTVVTDWERILSERKYRASDYLSAADQLIIRSGVTPSLRAFRTNPSYRAIPLVPEGARARGIEIVGNVLWLAGRDKFHRYTTSGTPQTDVAAGTRRWEGLAWDGENFWVTNDGEVFSYSPQGALQCSFSTPGNAPTAITWRDGRLWLAIEDDLVRANPATSCLNNSVDIEATVPSPVSNPVGLATDGANFYVASPTQVAVMTIAGAVLDTYTFKVETVAGITYANGGLWVIHQGPKGAGSRGQFLSRFLLPSS
jgi:hypothetical protein